jgi:hypothetical protein
MSNLFSPTRRTLRIYKRLWVGVCILFVMAGIHMTNRALTLTLDPSISEFRDVFGFGFVWIGVITTLLWVWATVMAVLEVRSYDRYIRDAERFVNGYQD